MLDIGNIQARNFQPLHGRTGYPGKAMHKPAGTIMRKIIAGAIAILLSGSVFGQGLEEIVVTAQKREQGANDVGITMNAFTGEMLQDFGFSTAEGIAKGMMAPSRMYTGNSSRG